MLTVAALLAAAGCASAPAPQRSASAPLEDVRTSLGRIGILAGTSPPSGNWNMPAKGAAEGAKRDAYVGAAGALHAGGLGPLLAPVQALIGGIYGAAKAEPAEIVEAAEAAIKSAFAAAQLPDTLRDRVVAIARAETRHPVVPQEDVATADATANRPEQAAGVIDTSLEIQVQRYGTLAARTPNPPVYLCFVAHVSLLRVADGHILYSQRFAWVSPGRPITVWGVANGESVRQELGRGIQAVAERIVDVVFLLWPFP